MSVLRIAEGAVLEDGAAEPGVVEGQGETEFAATQIGVADLGGAGGEPERDGYAHGPGAPEEIARAEDERAVVDAEVEQHRPAAGAAFEQAPVLRRTLDRTHFERQSERPLVA